MEMLGELQPWTSGWMQPWHSGWSVLQEMNRFRQEMDRLFERFFGQDLSEAPTPMWPRAESHVENGQLVMRFDLPGVDPNQIDISFAGDTLTIKASRERHGDGQAEHSEVYERSFTLPGGIQADQIKASYRNGVLELAAPLPPELTQRKIPVQVGADDTKRLESKSA
jgi:HSP20 family protein